MNISFCKKCGFILGTRPGLRDENGVCLACINAENKRLIDFGSRQKWLTEYIAANKTHAKYDCAVAVSGGKDSHAIVYRLKKEHGVKNPLLISVSDEFTPTQAGIWNRSNIASYFNADHLSFRCNPEEFKYHTLTDFEKELHPLKWFEQQIYQIPIKIASDMGIKLIFFGENSAFEYGSSKELEIFHPCTTDAIKVIFMGSIWPYSIHDSLDIAKNCGFRDLDYYNEWQRVGASDSFSQIDSQGYIVHIWCKYVKFGFQRTSDMACRLVRDGLLTKEQASVLIRENDHLLDRAAKLDFCRTVSITEDYFDSVVDRHANTELVRKDINGIWRLKY